MPGQLLADNFLIATGCRSQKVRLLDEHAADVAHNPRIDLKAVIHRHQHHQHHRNFLEIAILEAAAPFRQADGKAGMGDAIGTGMQQGKAELSKNLAGNLLTLCQGLHNHLLPLRLDRHALADGEQQPVKGNVRRCLKTPQMLDDAADACRHPVHLIKGSRMPVPCALLPGQPLKLVYQAAYFPDISLAQ